MTAYQTFQLVALLFLGAVFGLPRLARRFPRVEWLQRLRIELPQLTEAQRVARRRRADFYSGVELILVGIALPFGYVVLTVMMFSDMTPAGIAVTGALTVLCIGMGVTAIIQSRR